MKRIHIHVGVKNLDQSIQFYSTLFGEKPVKEKHDYAKWMLENPRLNFAISTLTKTHGVDHMGIQVEDENELTEIKARLESASLRIHDQGETTCCYAKSNKAWVEDPSGIAWEAYQNMADAETYSGVATNTVSNDETSENACCAPNLESKKSSKASCC